MENATPKEALLAKLDQFELPVNYHEGKMVYLEQGYTIEVEGPQLFKLLQDGYVIAPFGDLESLCDFIKKDLELNEEA